MSAPSLTSSTSSLSSSSSSLSLSSSSSSRKPSTFSTPSKFRSKATSSLHSSSMPPKKGSLSNKAIGAICILAAAVFALIALFTLASAIFAASSGAGPAAVAVGVIGVTIFAGLTIACVSIGIHYFRKL